MRLNILVYLFVLLTSCGNNSSHEQPQDVITTTTNTATPVKPVFNAGELIERINCPNDPTLSFALYLPSSYSEKEKLPLIIFFDPHGDGTFPLNKYRKLADQYGYLLMGSNDSKNGNPAPATAHILESMMLSATSMLNMDSSRMYAAGFSGGARVAAMLGLSPSGIQGIALSGAGFPASQWTSVPPSIIVAMSGNSDMNLSEFLTLKPAEEFKGRFQLIRYQGKHEWPPEEIFENAFMAFESFAMRDQLRTTDQKVLQHINSRFHQQSAQLNVGGRLIESKLLYEAWIKDLDGLTNTADIVKTYNEMIGRPQYQMTVKNEERVLGEELKLRSDFAQSVGTKDTLWWHNSMQGLQVEIKKSNDRQRSEMLQRVQSYASLAIYSALSQSMRTNIQDTRSSGYLTAIYRICDPENPEAWYLSAIISSLQSNPNEALVFLGKSVDVGFSDLKRVQTEAAFSTLSSSPEFDKLLNRMRQQTGGMH